MHISTFLDNINETSNVTSSTKWNRRMSRDLNYSMIAKKVYYFLKL